SRDLRRRLPQPRRHNPPRAVQRRNHRPGPGAVRGHADLWRRAGEDQRRGDWGDCLSREEGEVRVLNVEQGSEQWELLRIVRPTASNFGRIITPKTGALSKQHTDYACELV